MAEKDFVIKASEAAALLALGEPDAALAYIYIREYGASGERAADLALSRERAEAAMASLRRAGLLAAGSVEPQDAPPEYTAADVRDRMAGSAEFSGLVQEAQRRLGRVLSGSDLTALFGIYDYLKMPPDVLLLLIAGCAADWERKYGEGRTPSLRYIEKEAYAWARMDIMTAAAAEEHIRRRAENRTKEAEIRRALGIRQRALSPTEGRYVASWLEMGFSPAAVALAYDRTAVKTGGLNWRYMDSIMRSWHQKGLHAPEEIELGDSKPRRAEQKRETAPDRESLDRMRRYADRIKGGGDDVS